ncbi:MAG: hypothetical protein IKZ59_08365 [Clostridia bacterium]|nr:hypothetical protein [Clostridia bacterium]
MDISKIDSNFKIDSKISKPDIRFYNANQPPFTLYGVYYDNGKYCRMPESVAKNTNEGVLSLYDNTAGGRVAFKTDSDYIAIYAKMHKVNKSSHMPITCSAGFDLYERVNKKHKFINAFMPPFDIETGYESVIELSSGGLREYIINFPTYSGVIDLYIGLNKNAAVKAADSYDGDKPIVYYGSSITQGGCASRPGNSYEALISSWLNRDYINLGFSGNAKGEDAIAEYISRLDMSFFVYDYDYNAPDADYLRATHERMFGIIRKANPDLPILIVSMPKHRLSENGIKRLNVIKSTYENAVKNGDKNVYFLAGNEMFDDVADDTGTVDGVHPGDYGFYVMAKKIGAIIENINN